jgi:hypothetical protein
LQTPLESKLAPITQVVQTAGLSAVHVAHNCPIHGKHEIPVPEEVKLDPYKRL